VGEMMIIIQICFTTEPRSGLMTNLGLTRVRHISYTELSFSYTEFAFFNLLFTFFGDFSCSCLQKALLLQSGNHRLCHTASSKSQLKTTGRCEPLDVEHLGHPIHIGMKPGNNRL